MCGSGRWEGGEEAGGGAGERVCRVALTGEPSGVWRRGGASRGRPSFLSSEVMGEGAPPTGDGSLLVPRPSSRGVALPGAPALLRCLGSSAPRPSRSAASQAGVPASKCRAAPTCPVAWDLAVPCVRASHAWTCCLLGQMPSPGSTHLTPPPPAPSSCPCWEPAAPEVPWAEGLGTAAAPWTPGSQLPLSFGMHPGETSGPPACLWLAFSRQAHCPGLPPGSRAHQSRDVSALGPSERTRWSGHLARL